LFGGRLCAEASYCSPGWTFLPLSKGARKIAKIGPPASLFHTAWLRGALDEFRRQKAEKSFEVFLHDFAASQGKPAPVIDVLTCGWNG
jgi:hypothetical protein